MKFIQKLQVLIFLCACSTWAQGNQYLIKPLKSKGFTIPEKQVRSILFSPDGQLVLISFLKTPAKVYDANSWNLLYTFPDQLDLSTIRVAAFSPDSATVVTAGWEQNLNVWEAKSGKLIRSLAHEKEVIRSVAFSPDGEKIVAGLVGGVTVVWNANTGERMFTLTGNFGDIESVSFSPDGKTIFTADDNETAKLWDTQSGKFKFALFGSKYWTPAANDRDNRDTHQPWKHTISFSPDSQKMLTTSYSEEAKVWDTKSTKLLFGLVMAKKSYLRLAFFSPDGKSIFTASTKDDMAILWNGDDGKQTHKLDTKEPTYHAAFSPNSDILVTTFLESPAKVWDVTEGKSLFSLETDKNYISNVSFSPSGHQLVAGFQNGDVKIYNANDGTLIFALSLTDS